MKNAFDVDIPKNDPDMEELATLYRVKQAISSKKKELKERDWNNKHPNLVDLVDQHRKRKVECTLKDEQTKQTKQAKPAKPEPAKPEQAKPVPVPVPAKPVPVPVPVPAKPVEQFNKSIATPVEPVSYVAGANGKWF